MNLHALEISRVKLETGEPSLPSESGQQQPQRFVRNANYWAQYLPTEPETLGWGPRILVRYLMHNPHERTTLEPEDHRSKHN